MRRLYLCLTSDTSLTICGKSKMTCCKNNAENNLIKLGQGKMRSFIAPVEKQLASTFQNKTKKFEGRCNSLTESLHSAYKI